MDCASYDSRTKKTTATCGIKTGGEYDHHNVLSCRGVSVRRVPVPAHGLARTRGVDEVLRDCRSCCVGGDNMTDREIMLESENQALRDEIAMWRYRISVDDRLLHYIPAAVIDECVAVLDHGEIKHPGEEWKTKVPHVHMMAAAGHLAEFTVKGREREEESGRYHLAHAIVRYMMALAQFMGAVQIHEEEL